MVPTSCSIPVSNQTGPAEKRNIIALEAMRGEASVRAELLRVNGPAIGGSVFAIEAQLLP